MRNNALSLFFAAMVCVAVPGPLLAHHGTAGYDMDKQLVIKATVTDWLWANPHCFLTFDATDDKGATVRWTAEVSNPVDMTKRGWSRRILNPGDQITVTVRPAKNGAPVGQLLKVVLPNGQTLMGWNPPAR